MHIPPGQRLIEPAYRIYGADRPGAPPQLPIVLSSPHSGRCYPAALLAASRLDARSIRQSEDSFVDELFMGATAHGAVLLAAQFPRAYCDVNREAGELDPAMFDGALPGGGVVSSPRVAAGLGVIPRMVASGADIYRDKLPVQEAERRLRQYYWPYHEALAGLAARAAVQFGWRLVLDCHSMPSSALPHDRRYGAGRLDFVLGDRFANSCAGRFTDMAEDFLTARGYRVARNTPYAGGYCTGQYGRPAAGLHALQIEVNRALYMDEARHRRKARMAVVAEDMAALVALLAADGRRQMLAAAE